jgi:hypothetical protein
MNEVTDFSSFIHIYVWLCYFKLLAIKNNHYLKVSSSISCMFIMVWFLIRSNLESKQKYIFSCCCNKKDTVLYKQGNFFLHLFLQQILNKCLLCGYKMNKSPTLISRNLVFRGSKAYI